LAYGFVGLGKFVEIFIPWEVVQPYVPFEIPAQYIPHFYGVVFTIIATFYSVLGGMHSIVLGDVIKYGIMTLACLAIAFIAMDHLQGQTLHLPQGWRTPFFGWELGLDWKPILPEVHQKIESDGYGIFGIFFHDVAQRRFCFVGRSSAKL
jgi:hypothetical protein